MTQLWYMDARSDIYMERCAKCDHKFSYPKEKIGTKEVYEMRNHICKGDDDMPHDQFDDKLESIKQEMLRQKAMNIVKSALDIQEGGSHYKDCKIQPIEYIHANGLEFVEGSVVKYVTRWRNKGGIADLKKAKHFLELLIELEAKDD